MKKEKHKLNKCEYDNRLHLGYSFSYFLCHEEKKIKMNNYNGIIDEFVSIENTLI